MADLHEACLKVRMDIAFPAICDTDRRSMRLAGRLYLKVKKAAPETGRPFCYPKDASGCRDAFLEIER